MKDTTDMEITEERVEVVRADIEQAGSLESYLETRLGHLILECGLAVYGDEVFDANGSRKFIEPGVGEGTLAERIQHGLRAWAIEAEVEPVIELKATTPVA